MMRPKCCMKIESPVYNKYIHPFLREWVYPFLAIAAVIFPLKSSIAELNHVPTGSMKPTILEGDLLLVNKLAYDLKIPFTTYHLAKWDNPNRGDIVVCFSPEDKTRLVKRVVGKPGDILELRQNHLYVNGKQADYSALDHPVIDYLPEAERSISSFAIEEVENRSHAVMAMPMISRSHTFQPIKIPDGQYFLMGDNRDNSKDSRAFGLVPRDQIIGEATTVVVLPPFNASKNLRGFGLKL